MQTRAVGMLKVAPSPSLFSSVDALASTCLLLITHFSSFFGNKVNLRDRKRNCVRYNFICLQDYMIMSPLGQTVDVSVGY